MQVDYSFSVTCIIVGKSRVGWVGKSLYRAKVMISSPYECYKDPSHRTLRVPPTMHSVFFMVYLHEPQSLTMYYIRDERDDEALTLCRPMGLGFPAVRTRQEGKDKRYERQ